MKKTIKKITLEKLVMMVQKGFEETATKTETATKADLEVFKSEANERFDMVDERLNKIDNSSRLSCLAFLYILSGHHATSV